MIIFIEYYKFECLNYFCWIAVLFQYIPHLTLNIVNNYSFKNILSRFGESRWVALQMSVVFQTYHNRIASLLNASFSPLQKTCSYHGSHVFIYGETILLGEDHRHLI